MFFINYTMKIKFVSKKSKKLNTNGVLLVYQREIKSLNSSKIEILIVNPIKKR